MIRSIGVRNLSKKTIQKIRKMIAAVLAEPELYNQNTFGEKLCKTNGAATCGTTCCAAGWAVWLKDRSLYDKLMTKELKKQSVPWVPEALKALGLEVIDGYNTDILFGAAEEWPYPFCDQYDNATTDKGRARAFANRWRHFIKTDGIEDE